MGSARLRSAAMVAVSVAALGLAAPASAATPDTSGLQRFLLLQTKAAGTPTVFASGPIHAVGKDVVVNDTTDHFVFPTGTVTIVHKPTSHSQKFDRKTCLGEFHEAGVCKLPAGTGAYAHVSGGGKYTVVVFAVGCDRHKPPTQFSLVIDARGPASI